jgi:hypothetical protein
LGDAANVGFNQLDARGTEVVLKVPDVTAA